jgi:hypothetical protein
MEIRNECAVVASHRSRAGLLAITNKTMSPHTNLSVTALEQLYLLKCSFGIWLVIFRLDGKTPYAMAAVHTGKTGEVYSNTGDRMHPRVSTQSDARLAWLHLGSEGAASLRYDESGSSVRVQHYHRIEI